MGRKDDALSSKTRVFSLRVIKCYRYLQDERREYVISKQMLRSGTSIGANIAEGKYAESGLDFIHKLAIAQKECSETMYWIDVLHDAEFINEEQYQSIYNDAEEIMKLLVSSIKTLKAKLAH